MKYHPCIFEALSVKGDTLPPRDFTLAELSAPVYATDSGDHSAKLFDAEENGASLQLYFDCYWRDGCFEDNQLFAVYEKDDLAGLIEMFRNCMAEAY